MSDSSVTNVNAYLLDNNLGNWLYIGDECWRIIAAFWRHTSVALKHLQSTPNIQISKLIQAGTAWNKVTSEELDFAEIRVLSLLFATALASAPSFLASSTSAATDFFCEGSTIAPISMVLSSEFPSRRCFMRSFSLLTSVSAHVSCTNRRDPALHTYRETTFTSILHTLMWLLKKILGKRVLLTDMRWSPMFRIECDWTVYLIIIVTNLTLVKPDCINHAFHNTVQVCRVEYNDRRLPTQLQR